MSAVTKPKDIRYGEEALYQDGSLANAALASTTKFPGGDEGLQSATDSFIINQVPSSLRAACDCRTGKDHWDPIYVDPEIHNGSQDQTITPSNDVQVAVPPVLQGVF